MLLVDKYRVKTIEDITFHQDVYDRLLNVATIKPIGKTFSQQCKFIKNDYERKKKEKFARMGNLLIHGYNKTTLVNLLLQDLYGPDVLNVNQVQYNIEKYGAKGKVITVEQSQYHIVICPNGTGLDKYIIQEVVKEYASIELFQTNLTRVPYKIVLIKNADNLALYAQTSLRRTMEIYYKTCRFILCVNESSKIIEPLRSRCSLIRMSKPTNNDLITFLTNVSQKEHMSLPYTTIKYIVMKSNRDVNTCLWWLQHYKYGITDFTISWKTYLKQIITTINYVYKNKKVVKQLAILQLRKIINELLLTNITCSEIMNELIYQLINSHPEYGYKMQLLFVNLFYKYDQNMATGTRHIIHIETLFIHLLKIAYER
jgi:replication factor C subunit 3/5